MNYTIYNYRNNPLNFRNVAVPTVIKSGVIVLTQLSPGYIGSATVTSAYLGIDWTIQYVGNNQKIVTLVPRTLVTLNLLGPYSIQWNTPGTIPAELLDATDIIFQGAMGGINVPCFYDMTLLVNGRAWIAGTASSSGSFAATNCRTAIKTP